LQKRQRNRFCCRVYQLPQLVKSGTAIRWIVQRSATSFRWPTRLPTSEGGILPLSAKGGEQKDQRRSVAGIDGYAGLAP
jgi:hypothetical protein